MKKIITSCLTFLVLGISNTYAAESEYSALCRERLKLEARIGLAKDYDVSLSQAKFVRLTAGLRMSRPGTIAGYELVTVGFEREDVDPVIETYKVSFSRNTEKDRAGDCKVLGISK